MIYVTASDQLQQFPLREDEGVHEACADCLERAAARRRFGESVRCFHVLHGMRRPLARAPQRIVPWRRR